MMDTNGEGENNNNDRIRGRKEDRRIRRRHIQHPLQQQRERSSKENIFTIDKQS